MNAAVTGGTGFIGQALVRLLVARGDAVRVLVRRQESDGMVRNLGAEPVRGDLTAPDGCRDLVRPESVVYHLAARVTTAGRWADFRRTTVEGTRRLLESALSSRPARFVYVSSGAVYAPDAASGSVSAERTPARPPGYNRYARAKLAAEDLVRTECERAGCPWSIVRLSCTVYGPGFSPLLRGFVPLAKRGLLCVVGDGRNQFATLYVDDAARAVLLAGTHLAAVGNIYDVASEEPVTQREFLDAAADVLGVPRARRELRSAAARRLAYWAAALGELAARVGIAGFPVDRSLLVLMSTNQEVDTARIRRELGWIPEVGFRDGMRRMGEWYRRLREDEQGAGGPDGDRVVEAGGA